MMKPGSGTVSKAVSDQILSEFFPIKGPTHKARVFPLLAGKGFQSPSETSTRPPIRLMLTSKYAAWRRKKGGAP